MNVILIVVGGVLIIVGILFTEFRSNDGKSVEQILFIQKKINGESWISFPTEVNDKLIEQVHQIDKLWMQFQPARQEKQSELYQEGGRLYQACPLAAWPLVRTEVLSAWAAQQCHLQPAHEFYPELKAKSVFKSSESKSE